MSWTALDLWAFHAINGYAGHSYLFDQIVFFFSVSNLVKTIPFVACVWVLWHRQQNSCRDQEIIVATILSVIVALALTRALSSALPYVARPYRTTGIGFHTPLISYEEPNEHLNNWSSFPSDHATYFFALTTGFWFISRWLGLTFGLLSVFIVWQRIYLGLHYPSDILAGAAIGIGTALIFNRPAMRRLAAAPVLWLQQQAPMLFNALFFVTIFEMGVLFNEIRQVMKGALIVLHHYGFLPIG